MTFLCRSVRLILTKNRLGLVRLSAASFSSMSKSKVLVTRSDYPKKSIELLESNVAPVSLTWRKMAESGLPEMYLAQQSYYFDHETECDYLREPMSEDAAKVKAYSEVELEVSNCVKDEPMEYINTVDPTVERENEADFPEDIVKVEFFNYFESSVSHYVKDELNEEINTVDVMFKREDEDCLPEDIVKVEAPDNFEIDMSSCVKNEPMEDVKTDVTAEKEDEAHFPEDIAKVEAYNEIEIEIEVSNGVKDEPMEDINTVDMKNEDEDAATACKSEIEETPHLLRRPLCSNGNITPRNKLKLFNKEANTDVNCSMQAGTTSGTKRWYYKDGTVRYSPQEPNALLRYVGACLQQIIKDGSFDMDKLEELHEQDYYQDGDALDEKGPCKIILCRRGEQKITLLNGKVRFHVWYRKAAKRELLDHDYCKRRLDDSYGLVGKGIEICVCVICDQGDQQVTVLRRRESLAMFWNQKLFSCFFRCGYKSPDWKERDRHMLNHDGEPYVCDECGGCFLSECDQSRHTFTKYRNKVGGDICTQCLLAFASECEFRKHRITGNGEHICDKCGSSDLSSQCDLNFHRRPLAPIQCDKCDCPYISFCDFQRHRKRELRPCHSCGSDFQSLCSLQVHLSVISQLCLYCKYSFKSDCRFRAHKQAITKTCTRCAYKFQNRCDIRKHLSPLEKLCNECSDVFQSDCSFKKHETTTQMQCGYCLRSYKSKCHLKKHILAVTSITCDKCAFTIRSHCDIIRHELVCSRKVIFCNECGKSVQSCIGFKRHISTRGRSKVCKDCGGRFRSECLLMKHGKCRNGMNLYSAQCV